MLCRSVTLNSLLYHLSIFQGSAHCKPVLWKSSVILKHTANVVDTGLQMLKAGLVRWLLNTLMTRAWCLGPIR